MASFQQEEVWMQIKYGATKMIESERLFTNDKFRDITPGPGDYILPSNLISGRAKRFGKPQAIDIFNSKQTEYVPGPDTYFVNEIEVPTKSVQSDGFTFNRSPRVMFNEVRDKSHLVGFAETPFKEDLRRLSRHGGGVFSNQSRMNDELTNENLGPSTYFPNDSLTTKSQRSPTFRFGQNKINMAGVLDRRRSVINKETYEKFALKFYNIK